MYEATSDDNSKFKSKKFKNPPSSIHHQVSGNKKKPYRHTAISLH